MKTLYILNLKDGGQMLAKVDKPECIFWDYFVQCEQNMPVLEACVVTFLNDKNRCEAADINSCYPIEIDDYKNYTWLEMKDVAARRLGSTIRRLKTTTTFRMPRMDEDLAVLDETLKYLKDEKQKTTADENSGISQCSQEGCTSCGCA